MGCVGVAKRGGNPLDYARFMRQFKSKVIANCTDPEEKLNFLEQYTTHEAHDIVTGYSYLDPEKGYEKAFKELKYRYGNQDVIVHAFIEKALSWPQIKPDNPKELDRFSIFLRECENAVNSLDAIKTLEYSENMKRILAKLPYTMHDRWRNIVFQAKEIGSRPSFSQLVEFVSREAKKIIDPDFGREAMSTTVKPQKPPVTVRARSNVVSADVKHPNRSYRRPSVTLAGTDAKKVDTYERSGTNNAFTIPCLHCNGSHALETCKMLFKLPFYDRLDVLKLKGCCFGCLRAGHQRYNCKSKSTCTHCNGRHPSVLHVDGRIPPRSEVTSLSEKVNVIASVHAETPVTSDDHTRAGVDGNDDVTMAIIPVKVALHGSSRWIETYAFLDPGSNVSFCSQKLMTEIGSQGVRKKLTLNTMGVTHKMYSYELKNVVISDLAHQHVIQLPSLYTKEKMPVSQHHIPTTEDIQRWPHLEDLVLPKISADVGLLIGNNVPDAYSPLEVRVGPRGTPYASRTRLGWITWNVIRPGSCRINVSNRADVLAIQDLENTRNLETLYRKSLQIDFPESCIEKPEHSVEDRKFLDMMSKSKNFTDGHYEFCLPFREPPNLSDNRSQALQRLNSLKRKFQINPKFKADYTKFMTDILDKEFAEEVPANEIEGCSGKVWYIPHHGIYHPKKPDKIRVVFDCSSKYRGISLNQLLLQGPDMINNLLGVLLRFRLEEVAVMSDIECMFYQVKVTPDDRDYLRFFWWPTGNMDLVPVQYRMKVHLFGATSSPSCANYALRQTVEDNQDYFEHNICDEVRNSFYVDDFLCSVATEEEAIHLMNEITFMCSLGGFRLTKWMSNKKSVLESVKEPERAKNVRDLSFGKFPSDRALGVHWDVETDSFGFQISALTCKPTILSLVSSVYDPLGLAAPFVLSAKIILQEACRQDLGWDQELSQNELQKWNQWLKDLPKLVNLSVPRCLKPILFGETTNVQLHHFSDASEYGYGVTSYISS